MRFFVNNPLSPRIAEGLKGGGYYAVHFLKKGLQESEGKVIVDGVRRHSPLGLKPYDRNGEDRKAK